MNLIMEIYRGDDKMIEDIQILVDRFFPEPALKDLALQMIHSWYRAADLITRLSSDELHKVLTQPTVDSVVDAYLDRLEEDLYGYAGKARYMAQLRLPEAKLCVTALERGFLMWAEIKSEAYCQLAELTNAIARRIEDAFGDILPTVLGSFVAGQTTRFSSGVFRGAQSKFVEERTALMALAASAIFPSGEKEAEENELVKQLIKVSMKVTGLRYATHFNPYLGDAERQARDQWFRLQSSESVKARLAWIEKAVEGGGSKRKITLIPHPVYMKGEGLFEGKFPTPFMAIPHRYWKSAILKDDAFPSDILQGKVPLIPVHPRYLFLTPSVKQVPIIGTYGSRGSGKSIILDSLACWSIDRGYVVLRLSVPRDQGLNVIMPMMPYDKRDFNYLTKQLRITPRGFPAKFITVAENDSDLDERSAYTRNDLILFVDDLTDYRLPWKKILGPPDGPFSRGYLMARELNSEARSKLMTATLIRDFFKYRKNDRSRRIRLQTDEIQQLFSAVMKSSEEAAVVASLQSNLADIRGLNLPFDWNTQRPASLQPESLEMLSTFIFGELRESGAERSQSSRGRVLEAIRVLLDDNEKAFLPLIEKIMANVPLSGNPRDPNAPRLFFMLDHLRKFHLVRSMLPPHTVETPNVDPRTQLERYEKEAPGQSVLQPLSQVERIYLRGGGQDRPEKKREMY